MILVFKTVNLFQALTGLRVRVYGLGFMGYGISVPLKSDNIRIEVSYVNKNKKKKQKCEESSGPCKKQRSKDNSPSLGKGWP